MSADHVADPDHVEDPDRGAIFVGLGRVLAVLADGRPRVQVFDDAATTTIAEWALPYRYVAAIGDLLQLMAHRGHCWVTGVTHGHGRSQLAFAGDATLHANGTLRLASDAGVRLRGPRVQLQTDELHTTARTVVQKIGELDLHARGEIDERAGQSSRSIEHEDRQVAGRHETIADRVVKIDGDLLQLG